MKQDERQDKLNKEPQDSVSGTERAQENTASVQAPSEAAAGHAPSNVASGQGAEGSSQERDAGQKDGSYSFLKQTIRKKPVDYGRIFRRFALVLAGAAAAGAVAALTSAAVLPKAQKMMGNDPKEEVRIGGSEGTEALSASSSSVSGTSQNDDGRQDGESVTAASVSGEDSETVVSSSGQASGTAGSAADGALAGQAGYSPDSDGTSSAQQPTIIRESMTPDEYKVLYRRMTEASGEAEKAIVRVTAASDLMDFFNRTYVSQNQSTGIIVARTSTNLYILVQDANIPTATTIQLTFCDNTITEGTFVKLDPATNLAIVTVATSSLDTGTLADIAIAPLGNSFTVSKGEPILAVGSPMGYSDSVIMGTITSTTNNVSLTDRQYTILTTDISASEKSSGILVDLDGQIIGFIAQGLAEGNSQTVTGLAISKITNLIERLSNAESLPYIGIQGTDVNDELSAETGVPVGVMVTLVEPDSPAMLCGLKEGDVITQLGSGQVTGMQAYMATLSAMEEDQTVTIHAMRQGISGYEEVSFDCTVRGR